MGAVALVMGCGPSEPPPAAPPAAATETTAAAADPLMKQAQALFAVLPERMESDGREITDAKVALGRTLFHDPRLSKNQDLSCASCHALDNFGVDPRPEALDWRTSSGHQGQFGTRNSPTVYNAALHIAQFWDGRAADVEEQAKAPILNPVEMAMPDEASVIAVLQSVPGYLPMFVAAFPGDAEPISYDHMAEAIGAYERLLVTPAPFDAYLAGDTAALTEAQRQGLDLFIAKGCPACHQGAAMGGSMYQKLGFVEPYPTEDTGRFEATGNELDKYFFKVPSLRNIVETAPYLHDGSSKTLNEVIRFMARHQTAFGDLTDAEAAGIEAFFGSLTGTPPADLVTAPELPESGPDTPAPDPT